MFKVRKLSLYGLLIVSLNAGGSAQGGIASSEQEGSEQNASPASSEVAEGQVKRLDPGVPGPRTRGVSPASNKVDVKVFLVDGYRNADYVYGEMRAQTGQSVEGYIYHANGRKTYIYGERVEKQIQAYDRKGNLFSLRVLD